MSDFEDDLLDDEQRAAVEATERTIAVLAGPGSGKTRVLSHRTRHVLGLAGSTNALLLTFTNKAAAEMKARALGVSVVTSDRIWASTFHTFALQILKAHYELAGLNPEFEVLDEDERSQIAAEAALRAGVTDRSRRFSYLRLRLQEAGESEVVRFADAYQSLKNERQILDFDDLIIYAAQLLTDNPNLASAYGTRYQDVLVDEFQDTNAAQFAIVTALTPHARSVSVFADDDQAIYRFAGAESENVQRFIAQLGAQKYPLTVNYRCRAAIVECANRLIAADPRASGRQMRAHFQGGEVRTVVSSSMEEEAVIVANDIQGLIQSQAARPNEVAILARAAFRVRSLLGQLQSLGVPVSNWLIAAHEPKERRALRTCLSLLRGPLTDHQARRFSELLGTPISAERDPDRLLELSPPGVASALRHVRDLAWSGASVADVVKSAQQAVAWIDEGLSREMEGLVADAVAFEQFDPNFGLDHLFTELALGGVGGAPTSGGGVKIATLHRTKGLQWAHVYIIGLEEGKLPDFHAETDEEIREERRACFVGICRAERRLTLTRARFYGRFAQRPSRFLQDMGL